MNQKELGEIRRRFRPEHNNIQHLYGCYVNSNKEIVSSFDESFGLLSQTEGEKYLALLKKTLSGALGKNLLDITFATKQVVDSEEHRLLSALRASELRDETLREAFYRCVIDAVELDSQNYLILLAYDVYDVPHRGRDGHGEEDGGDVYRYLVCAVCPVKDGKSELGYVAEDKRFHSAAAAQLVSAPELGFLFPSFDGRTANLYNALFYSKNSSEIHSEFVDAVFRTEIPLSAGKEKELFDTLLTESFDSHAQFDVVQAVHEQLAERLVLHKESRDPEPLTLTPQEMEEILENSGAAPEQAQSFRRRCEQELGRDAALRPGNLASATKMEIKTPEVSIRFDPKNSHLIESRVLDGRRYLLIAADAGVELNGVPVEITAD